jgi:glycosyltransferase involved in cell wall biosynthesis
MKIGLLSTSDAWDSLNHVREMTARALSGCRHELLAFPEAYQFASRVRRRELLRDWLKTCDVVLGVLHPDILQARREFNVPVPLAVFVLGSMPRGAIGFQHNYQYLSSDDVLICNCRADAIITSRFFNNPTLCVIPFGVDEAVFHPADAASRASARQSLAIEPDAPLLLYSGRLTLEKNIHTVLKVFKIVLSAIPRARLLIAGDEIGSPHRDFGIIHTSVKRSLRRLKEFLEIDVSRVMFIGRRTAEELRALYSTADLLINLTLHHDENFGLAQIEAMACGLPVVGTTWGGLKDTIIDDVTGMRVPAIATAIGVKVDWWCAANHIVRLLSAGELIQHMRQRCCEVARSQYSLQGYGERLNHVLNDCVKASKASARTLEASRFAKDYWGTCVRKEGDAPPYRRGPLALERYRDLITPYAFDAYDCDQKSDRWYLPAPLVLQPDHTLSVNDPIFPMEVQVPEHLVDAVYRLTAHFTAHPILSDESLDQGEGCGAALQWMHATGLLLRTVRGVLPLECVPSTIGQSVFQLQRVDHQADVVWLS